MPKFEAGRWYLISSVPQQSILDTFNRLVNSYFDSANSELPLGIAFACFAGESGEEDSILPVSPADVTFHGQNISHSENDNHNVNWRIIALDEREVMTEKVGIWVLTREVKKNTPVRPDLPMKPKASVPVWVYENGGITQTFDQLPGGKYRGTLLLRTMYISGGEEVTVPEFLLNNSGQAPLIFDNGSSTDTFIEFCAPSITSDATESTSYFAPNQFEITFQYNSSDSPTNLGGHDLIVTPGTIGLKLYFEVPPSYSESENDALEFLNTQKDYITNVLESNNNNAKITISIPGNELVLYYNMLLNSVLQTGAQALINNGNPSPWNFYEVVDAAAAGPTYNLPEQPGTNQMPNNKKLHLDQATDVEGAEFGSAGIVYKTNDNSDDSIYFWIKNDDTKFGYFYDIFSRYYIQILNPYTKYQIRAFTSNNDNDEVSIQHVTMTQFWSPHDDNGPLTEGKVGNYTRFQIDGPNVAEKFRYSKIRFTSVLVDGHVTQWNKVDELYVLEARTQEARSQGIGEYYVWWN